jgi:hypothetical protein
VSQTHEKVANVSIPDFSDPAAFADAIPHAAFAEIQRR